MRVSVFRGVAPAARGAIPHTEADSAAGLGVSFEEEEENEEVDAAFISRHQAWVRWRQTLRWPPVLEGGPAVNAVLAATCDRQFARIFGSLRGVHAEDLSIRILEAWVQSGGVWLRLQIGEEVVHSVDAAAGRSTLVNEVVVQLYQSGNQQQPPQDEWTDGWGS